MRVWGEGGGNIQTINNQVSQVAVRLVVVSLRAAQEHEVILEESSLLACKTHFQLFDELSDHMNYLTYVLLDQLVEKLTQKYDSFETIGGKMAKYKYRLDSALR